jgi:hypothetical protein
MSICFPTRPPSGGGWPATRLPRGRYQPCCLPSRASKCNTDDTSINCTGDPVSAFQLDALHVVASRGCWVGPITTTGNKVILVSCTAKTQYRKFETNVLWKGWRGISPNFHIHVSVSYLYSQDRSAFSAEGKYVDGSCEYVNRSQTHECGSWDWGRAIPFLGIHLLGFSLQCEADMTARSEW